MKVKANKESKKNKKISIIGLGYVGLPLAVEFGKYREVIGFDIDQSRVNDLTNGYDKTFEISIEDLKKANNLDFTNNLEDLMDSRIYIITVPTPIDEKNKPDLTPLESASKTIGMVLKKGDIVIYESTVYPGATEEICIPILEQNSGLEFNKDFYCGYSPERINPGDREHRLASIKKVTSGSTKEIAIEVDELYQEIIKAGTYRAKSIKVAEAAKVIENTQRDVNIALINELALIFNKLNIDTESVLEAAESKWNFLPFKPGLVGGHCIGVDPYYLTHKAIEIGYSPEMILAGRKLNDSMGVYVANKVLELMSSKKINTRNPNILIMGFTFKENCSDIRNTRVVDVLEEFKVRNCNVDLFDPIADKDEVLKEYNLRLIHEPEIGKYDSIVLAVAHDVFKNLSIDKIRIYGKLNHVIYDIKYIFRVDEVDGRL
jgi:UDP-N-acetyl-D-glucosamine/UDP-N-acetyl-D-galactosamine dehydrogenase